MTLSFTAPTPLPAPVLAARTTLPRKPAPVSLRGGGVRVEPTDLDRDAERLHALTDGRAARLGDRSIDAYDADERVWRYLFDGPFASVDGFLAYLAPQVDAANGRCFTVFDDATGDPVGIVNYMNNSSADLKVELGGIFYSPLVHRTGVNPAATFLLADHAFALGYRRVEWKCNALNDRSRRAALRMGFRFEGIQESHMIVKGCSRDTAWFRILAHEWPDARNRLRALLTP